MTPRRGGARRAAPGFGECPGATSASRAPRIADDARMRARLTSLCVPGTRADRHAKALALPCDEVVLDLEDAVAPEHKEAARATVVRTLADPAWAARTVAVRINAGSGADLEAVAAAAGPEGLTVLLPKVERPEQVAEAAGRLAGTGIGLQALIETPAGSAASYEIAAAAESLVA